ncbi:hypothetical protein VF14_11115 [Nostoc linckia z18]|jgi:hypothetical protein|uniref:Uncharacterized protein n=3 Tax=Nostoc TaxID=1177 RepID=A0A9Q5ZF62_NOSLI|nr:MULTISPECIES: hypothetical protein [Nostoc]MBL1200931.1 hypothetical protein [Nostoc sp. GBBB01]MDZ8010692.1 hypothetical protein [Nostoc sp. ZfuVER08]PHK29774.1 hypothetical protein VF12_30530 [Nostoc linckia z15]PHK46276.1 hypothetical protein VF13_11940 [Nostoc linckia z16]MBC1240328.1 hypothetical protein [Nostoc sp. 2RC]
MSEQQKSTKQDNTTASSGGYQTTLDEANRQTGDAEKSDAKTSATPEAPQNDTVQGSPNQGTESR